MPKPNRLLEECTKDCQLISPNGEISSWKYITVAEAVNSPSRAIIWLGSEMIPVDPESLVLGQSLSNTHLSNTPDVIQWRWFSQRTFTTKNCYQFFLDGEIRPLCSVIVWELGIPPRVQYFLYLSYLDKILTKANLAKRG